MFLKTCFGQVVIHVALGAFVMTHANAFQAIVATNYTRDVTQFSLVNPYCLRPRKGRMQLSLLRTSFAAVLISERPSQQNICRELECHRFEHGYAGWCPYLYTVPSHRMSRVTHMGKRPESSPEAGSVNSMQLHSTRSTHYCLELWGQGSSVQ